MNFESPLKSNRIVALDNLIPHPDNYRQHPDEQVQKLVLSLQRFGQGRSIVIQDSPGKQLIVAGHGIVEAAKALKWPELRADILPADWTPEQIKGYLIADNQHAQGASDDDEILARLLQEQQDMGIDLASLGTDDEALRQMLESLGDEYIAGEIEEGDGGDEFDTTPEEGPTRTNVGELWQLGKHRLLVGDSTKREDVERLMQGGKVDCIFTSPPYAVGVEYGEYEDTIENLRTMLPKLATLWLDVVIDGGFAVINFGDIASGRNITETEEPCEYPMAIEYWPVFRAAGWLLWSRRIWCKPNPRVNSMQCIQSNRAATDWEHIWTWRKSGKPIVHRVDGEMRSPLGWIDTTHEEGVSIGKETHGAGMAVSIAVHMLNVHSRDASLIYEPFGGTGTTLIAGHRLRRKVFVCELEPRSADIILRRYEAETGHTAQLLDRVEEVARA